MGVKNVKVPAALATGIICLLVGGGLGAVIMYYAAEEKREERQPLAQKGDNQYEERTKGGPKAPPPEGKKDQTPVRQPPVAKAQLVQLVEKLDSLTRKPLTVELNADQKKQMKELLAGLGAAEELAHDDAQTKLDALIKVLEPQRATLEAAGYRWPGSPPPKKGGDPQPPNPFKEGPGAAHLNSLLDTLGK